MFGNRYFAPRYFGDRYFGPGPVALVNTDITDYHDGKPTERTHEYLDKARERREELRAKLRNASDEVNGIRREREPEPVASPVVVSITAPPTPTMRPQINRAGAQAQIAAMREELMALEQQRAAAIEMALEEEAIEILLLAA